MKEASPRSSTEQAPAFPEQILILIWHEAEAGEIYLFVFETL